jgi:hypothetical protein
MMLTVVVAIIPMILLHIYECLLNPRCPTQFNFGDVIITGEPPQQMGLAKYVVGTAHIRHVYVCLSRKPPDVAFLTNRRDKNVFDVSF